MVLKAVEYGVPYDLVSIDPGLTGAIVRITVNYSEIMICFDEMPTVPVKVNNSFKNVINIRKFNELALIDHGEIIDIKYVTEDVRPLPMDSRSSCFSFGGAVLTMYACLKGRHITAIDPKEWKRRFYLISAGKKAVVEKALDVLDMLGEDYVIKDTARLVSGIKMCNEHTRIAICDALLLGIHHLCNEGVIDGELINNKLKEKHKTKVIKC